MVPPARPRWLAIAALLGGAALATAQIPGPLSAGEFAARKATHWAWQPLWDGPPPRAEGHPVDAFVDARLAAAGLHRAPPAAPEQQLRRLWFDLVGLPPPPDVVATFAGAPDDAAWTRQVDALLASPHFGERHARHWLDLVRYAETLGHEYDFAIPNAWRYRDYVIRAINADVPYDQFVREHIAGDLLPAPRRDAAGNDESVQATAAWWFVEQTHSPVDAAQHQADRIDNQVDVLGKAILGMTVACARCHDHKFDAIRAADYYGLVGFVQSSRYVQVPIRPCDVRGEDYMRALAAQRVVTAAWGRAATGVAWQAQRQRWRWFQPPPPPGKEPPAPPPPDRSDWNELPELLELRPGDLVVASVDGRRDEWRHTNDGFGPEPWGGPFCPDPEEARPQLFVLPGRFWNSAVAGLRREGVLATATFPLAERYVHVRAAGQGSRILMIVDGFHLVRDPIYGDLHRRIDDPNAHWVTFDAGAWVGRPAFLQCIDQTTPDLADPHYERSAYPAKAWLAVQSIVLSPHAEPPPQRDLVPLPPPGFTAPPDELRAALAALAAAQAALPVSPTLPGFADGTGRDEHVFLRGDHRRPGAVAPRRFLQALAGNAPFVTGPGSGRIALADAVLSPDNPLVARVFVNRLWHHLFGRGLVRTVDNLGALGERPSHPELLDWLAREAVQRGWSRKAMLRLLVTSATYRQDASHRDEAATIDPNNALLHRMNVRRLSAEAVRDSLLAISGRFDPTLYGPSIELPESLHIDARGRPRDHGPIDGHGRRSIYLAMRRNFLPPMLIAFDLPTPFATVGARNVSNVPAQALALANDPFLHEQCARWATALLAAGHPDDAAALRDAYLRAFARAPRGDELVTCRTFLAAAGPDPTTAWSDLLHGLTNTTEFLYLR